ncbi:RIP metalloprotease RseP [methane-oxidizing endosymbiont of Gigantopelta aegis]|uniref:RIP metalloprotease RseP n=1 Tax=methane-oxidizing endosymbiont of Gigantopelta aegis TaxID=2794938 RepID=UPI0018DC938C|nr:RIP metalloprotease RseP [methane-oxidizing endosymbiont of Gigantopelta aegis]
MDILNSLFYFIVAIGILVSFHEFGHFWVARKVGVKVLRFSIGFGKVLWLHQSSPESTEYVISAIPLGGYVKMVDEREGEVKPEDLPYAFNRQPLWARTAIVAAGPIFNLILAVFFFWCVFIIGETGMRPVVAAPEPGTLAAQAGFEEGDEILSVNNETTPTWTEAISQVFEQTMTGAKKLEFEVKNNEGFEVERIVLLPEGAIEDTKSFYNKMGLKPWSPTIPPVIGKLLPNGAAAEAGLQSGDILLQADDEKIDDWMQWVNYVQARPGQPIKLLIERDGVRLNVTVTPKEITTKDGRTIGRIGASVKIPEQLIESLRVSYSLDPIQAIPKAFEKTWFYSISTLEMMGKMLIGKASVQNLSGPISIAQYAGESAEMGLVPFLKYLALISVSLGILNLLPIPVLDGGHLLFFAIEAVKGNPVSEKVQIFFQQLGLLMLLSLMMLAMFLDVERLFQ